MEFFAGHLCPQITGSWKNTHINKAERQVWYRDTSFPRSKPRPEGQSHIKQCFGKSSSGGNTRIWATTLPPGATGLPCKGSQSLVGELQLIKQKMSGKIRQSREEMFPSWALRKVSINLKKCIQQLNFFCSLDREWISVQGYKREQKLSRHIICCGSILFSTLAVCTWAALCTGLVSVSVSSLKNRHNSCHSIILNEWLPHKKLKKRLQVLYVVMQSWFLTESAVW